MKDISNAIMGFGMVLGAGVILLNFALKSIPPELITKKKSIKSINTRFLRDDEIYGSHLRKRETINYASPPDIVYKTKIISCYNPNNK